MSDSEVTVADARTELPGRVIATVSKMTRQSSAIFGVGNGLTELDAKVTCSQLPLSTHVFRRSIWHIESGVQGGRTRLYSADIEFLLTAAFYAKTNNIP